MTPMPLKGDARTPVWHAPKVKSRGPDPIRVLGFLLLLFVPIGIWSSMRFADTQTRRNVVAWVTMESSGVTAQAPVFDAVRMVHRGLLPAGLQVSPWPGLAASMLLGALGVVLLAVRPRRPSDEQGNFPRATVATVPPWERAGA